MIRLCLLAPVAGLPAFASPLAPQRDRAWTAIRAFLDKLSVPPQVTTAQ